MKKIAILLLICNCFLIQKAFSAHNALDRCGCMSVRLLENGEVRDCCGNSLGMFSHLARIQTKEQCLQTCVKKSWGKQLALLAPLQQKERQNALYKTCETSLKNHLATNSKNILENWCNLQNSRPTAK